MLKNLRNVIPIFELVSISYALKLQHECQRCDEILLGHCIRSSALQRILQREPVIICTKCNASDE